MLAPFLESKFFDDGTNRVKCCKYSLSDMMTVMNMITMMTMMTVITMMTIMNMITMIRSENIQSSENIPRSVDNLITKKYEK